jgi:predicted helicase
MFDVPKQIPNLNRELVEQIERKIGLKLDWDAGIDVSYGSGSDKFSPTDLLDYIYGVLHSPKYRETYREFLKIDFPRVPFGDEWMKLTGRTGDVTAEFWRVAELGGELRKIHLMESGDAGVGVGYPISDGNLVKNIKYLEGMVWINDTQYFDGVSQAAWDFYIGGYQPAQKWLKDRKEKILEISDIEHYMQIISALEQTSKSMLKID